MNWDDLRMFVVLAREKTLAAASRRLGVDQTTVARRLYAFEQSLGAALFERGEGRWRLTSFGLRALERAERIEEDVAGIVRCAEADAEGVTGLVRVTCVAAMSSEYLVHRLPDLYARHPDLVVDLIDSDENLNLAPRGFPTSRGANNYPERSKESRCDPFPSWTSPVRPRSPALESE